MYFVDDNTIRKRDLSADPAFESLVPDAVLVSLMRLFARRSLDDKTPRLSAEGHVLGREPSERHLNLQPILVLVHVNRRHERRL